MSATRPPAHTLVVVLGAGLIFRLTLLPLAPASSTDVYRYLWEGLVQVNGFDPYTVPPSDETLAFLAEAHPEIHERINHADIPTIYPPTAQGLFRLNAVLFGGSLLGWKLILLAFDALLAYALWHLTRAWRLPSWSLCGVLWCPLLILETYEGGHLDLVGVTLVVLAVLAVVRGRDVLAGIALGLSVDVKYPWPLLVMLLLLAQSGQRRRGFVTAGVGALVAVLCWGPYLSGLRTAWSTARLFAETWRFNGSLFDLLRLMPGPSWLPVAIVMLVLLVLVAFLVQRPGHHRWHDIWLVCGAAMLLSPVAFPWYLVWLVPGLLVRPPLWLIVWVLIVPVLHIVDWRERVSGEWHAMPWLCVAVGTVPGILLAQACWRRVTARGQAPSASGWLGDLDSVQEKRCAS